MADKKFNAVPNPVEGFMIDRDELETLAVHHFNEVIAYRWDRHAYPEEAISSQEWCAYMTAIYRLEDIEKILGAGKMAVLRKVAETDFKRHSTIGDEAWAEFTGQPVAAGEQL